MVESSPKSYIKLIFQNLVHSIQLITVPLYESRWIAYFILPQCNNLIKQSLYHLAKISYHFIKQHLYHLRPEKQIWGSNLKPTLMGNVESRDQQILIQPSLKLFSQIHQL